MRFESALPVVDGIEDIVKGLGQAHVHDQRQVGRQAHLHLELVELSSGRSLVGEQRGSSRDHPLHHLVELQARQTRRLALDQLLI